MSKFKNSFLLEFAIQFRISRNYIDQFMLILSCFLSKHSLNEPFRENFIFIHILSLLRLGYILIVILRLNTASRQWN